MARPKKAPADLRTEKQTIAYTPGELAEVQARAVRAKLNLTAFVRAASMKHPITVVESATPDIATRNEWRRIGSNIHQLLHGLNIANKTGMVEHRPYPEEVLKAVGEVHEQVNLLFDQWLNHGSTYRKERS